jgi:hypothetical protein
MSEPTPGPWYADDTAVLDNFNSDVARCNCEGRAGHWRGRGEMLANTNLIASAPDLFTVLERCEAYFSGGC